MSRCIVCGCTDDRACPGGCYWTRLSDSPMHHNARHYGRGELGICSCCEDDRPREGFDYVDDDDDQELQASTDLILPGDPEFFR
jgi:hypothetical protein